ncbi:MAG: DUF1492 domain-containing protein, partial [Bacteroidales bacterium]|nr:DUF1492 domain-containing protein [Bacteroidales bacterium]
RINSDIAEVERLRIMARSVNSPGFEAHYDPNHGAEAPFIRCLEKVWQMEEKINAEIDKLVDLKQQMRLAIGTVTNADEQMVLRYRYIHNKTWEQIGDELHADKSTVRRWHGAALQHIRVPEDPIII